MILTSKTELCEILIRKIALTLIIELQLDFTKDLNSYSIFYFFLARQTNLKFPLFSRFKIIVKALASVNSKDNQGLIRFNSNLAVPIVFWEISSSSQIFDRKNCYQENLRKVYWRSWGASWGLNDSRNHTKTRLICFTRTFVDHWF